MVGDLSREPTPHLGGLRDRARQLNLPESAALDLHRQIRMARGEPPLSPARESLEMMLWDVFHNPQRSDGGKLFSIYREYSRSRVQSPLSPRGDARHRAISADVRARYGSDPASTGVRTEIQGRDEQNYIFLHAYSHAADQARTPTTQRLYIRVDGDQVAPFFDRFVRTMVEPPTDFPGVNGGKMPGPGWASFRAESLVVYLSPRADVGRIALALAEMGGRAIRTDSRSVTPMTDEVVPGIRWASHPSPDLMRLQRALAGEDVSESFGKTRERPIAAGREQMANQPGGGDFDTFLNETLSLLRHWGVSVDDPSREDLQRLRESRRGGQ